MHDLIGKGLGDREQITADHQGHKGRHDNAPPHEYFVIPAHREKTGERTADPQYEAEQPGRKWTRGGVTKVTRVPRAARKRGAPGKTTPRPCRVPDRVRVWARPREVVHRTLHPSDGSRLLGVLTVEADRKVVKPRSASVETLARHSCEVL